MKQLRFYNALIVLLIITALVGMLALWFFQNAGRTDEPKVTAAVSPGPAKTPEPMSVLDQPLNKRLVIDDFSDLSLWRGDFDDSIPGVLTVAGDNGYLQVYRKFEGFLSLGTYLYLEIQAVDPQNVEWITLYLMEDLSETNYFECDLTPRLNDSVLILNKRDFAVGGGMPEWDSISTVKIAFETNGKSFELSVDELSTYSAAPVCTVWFDDGWKSVFDTAYPIMRERGLKGTLSVIGSHTEYPDYCNETELAALYEDGWDLVNHTHSHKNLNKLTLEEAETEIAQGFQYLSARGFTRACNNFVPPYSACREEIGEIVRKYAITSRQNWEMYNALPVTDPYRLGYWEVTPKMSPEEVSGLIDEAIKNDLWLILLFHSIEPGVYASTNYDPHDFEAIMELLVQKSTEIKTAALSEVLCSDRMEVPAREKIMPEPDTGVVTEDGWRLVWEDEFEKAEPDASVWNITLRPPCSNNELQTYAADCVRQKDGFLEIESRDSRSGYTSGCVTTDNKKIIHYGKLEIRAKMPRGKGLFPAFWLLPLTGEQLPEIDIMEFLGSEPDTVWHVYHFTDETGRKDRKYTKYRADRFDQEFHTFSLEWTEQSMRWLVDGKETFTVSEAVPSVKMYLIINTAVGGNWPGSPNSKTVFPQIMLIDYVRYYQRQN